MNNEIWKDVVGYEGLYEISNLGRIRSVDRVVEGRNGIVPGKILKTRDNGTGYEKVCLCKSNIKKDLYIHRLVAESFIPNPYGLKDVNHINEIRNDNRSINLEWCTPEYNQNYGTCPLKKRLAKISSVGKGVCSYDNNGVKIKEYLCISDVEHDGFIRRNVLMCCQGNRRVCGGLFWAFLGNKPIIRKQYARRKNL